MLLNVLSMIADFAVLVTRLTIEELTNEQRMVLIDEFIYLRGLDAAFQFDLRDLLIILMTVLIIIFWKTWKRAVR